MKEREYYITPKSSSIMRFLWKAAGGDRYILERATYSDQVKYMCLGGIVFATGAMAGLAGGYAFYTIFSPRGSAIDSVKEKLSEQAKLRVESFTPSGNLTDTVQNITDTVKNAIVSSSKVDSTQFNLLMEEALNSLNYQNTLAVLLSIFFGIVWGLMIFNIDRFIVTSTGKGDGTEDITWGEFKSAIPRILMGVIIALTISKPVEIRMFKTEIDIKLREKQLEQQASYQTKVDKSYEDREKLLLADFAKIETQRTDLLNRIKDYEEQYRKETAEGMGGRGQGEGPVARALKREQAKLELELQRFDEYHKEELAELNTRKKILRADKEKERNNNERIANGLDGLLERIKIAHEVAGFWITLFITLLFMAIELTPIFFKLMLTKTPYDYLAENRDELIKAENGIEVRYDYYKDKSGQERHLVINHAAERLTFEKMKVTDIQKELTAYAIEQYKIKEKKKIDENLEEYIQKIEKDERGDQ